MLAMGVVQMTSVADFTSNVISTLKYLDSGVLPAGSHLLLVGVLSLSPSTRLRSFFRSF